MLYSCLVDADFLDTERFMSNGSVARDPGNRFPYCVANWHNI